MSSSSGASTGATSRPSIARVVADGVVVLDGGLATRLEARGHDLSGGLWSARLLLDDPAAVATVHREFFAAGAQVATTASYQASGLALTRAGLDADLAPALLARSVEIAARARDEVRPDSWVAGSVGPYGAALADGSEYTGDYGLGDHAATVRALRDFHRPRVEALLAAGADVLACETVPRLAEMEALATVLADVGAPSWISLTVTRVVGDDPAAAGGPAPSGACDAPPVTRTGEALDDVGALLCDVPGLLAVGVNCCDPRDVVPALRVLADATGLCGVAYPNSGEGWDAAAQTWRGEGHWDAATPAEWVATGARLVGGCCRVGPGDIEALARLVTDVTRP